MHVLPQLRKLEQKYSSELVVVGVHSGKFLAERMTENIRHAILRLEIEHPVVNDRFFRTWRAYGVNAWPTLVLIDPDGGYLGSHAGETTFDLFDPVVGKTLANFEARGQLDRSPRVFRLEREAEPERPLAFPGKVLAIADGRLFIADTNHNRILVVRLEDAGNRGAVTEVIGKGQAGMQDGIFESATFSHPQGMTLAGDNLFVADTGNHAIRMVDLKSRRVTTIAGTGEQGRRLVGLGPGRQTALNSPWDLAFHRGTLYIAMAGWHQLWSMDIASGRVGVFAGSGIEDLTDSSLGGAALAQPCGIAVDSQKVFFADSESSSIRWADLGPPGKVRTVIGKGLFDYGDKDGGSDDALLQHPFGVTWHEGNLYVADTYNNKIKIVEPDSRSAGTFLGTGEGGLEDGDRAQFDEPEGVSAANGRLYIADTNNHVIRVAGIGARTVNTLRITGI